MHINWTVVSAVVQALSAAAIAVLTAYLVTYIRRYVNELAKANKLREQANVIESEAIAKATQTNAPYLSADAAGGQGQRGGEGDTRMKVQNRGSGLANDIEIDTDVGRMTIPQALGPIETYELSHHFDSGYNPDRQVVVIRFRFTDAAGNEWVQTPNHFPIRVREARD